jgi:glycosyltransferase involved in cell wall biosynthesis
MIDYCQNVFPLIRARRPAARVLNVGADPIAVVQKLGELAGVTVTGSVPDVRPYLRRSAVMVAPLTIARGTQNKILEAMAAGVPVVTSTVAAGGVDAIAGTHLLVADGAEDVAAATLSLMENPERRAQIARAARGRVLSNHAWDRSMRRLDGIIERCVDGFVRRSALQAA